MAGTISGLVKMGCGPPIPAQTPFTLACRSIAVSGSIGTMQYVCIRSSQTGRPGLAGSSAAQVVTNRNVTRSQAEAASATLFKRGLFRPLEAEEGSDNHWNRE